ncbi:MAG: alkaline phosphatase family protein [Atribacterota bacterium]|nr:alkaline phosphatase family protein [Atribacterota bacterium]
MVIKKKRVILIVWDGLRSDFVNKRFTPNLFEFASKGVLFKNHHSVFPSCTRVNCASMVTGCYPDMHGLMGNQIYICDKNQDLKVISTSNYKLLKEYNRQTKGNMLRKTSITEILNDHQKKSLVLSTGSGGSAYIFDHKESGVVINSSFCFPAEISEQLRKKIGPFPVEEVPNKEQNKYLVQSFFNYFLPEMDPDLTILYLCEPDKTQHYYGIGTVQSCQTIKDNDDLFGEFLIGLQQYNSVNETDILITSDHGGSTITGTVNPVDLLIEGGFKENENSDDLTIVSSDGSIGIYLKNWQKNKIIEIIKYLQEHEWVGPIFSKTGRGKLGLTPEIMNLELIRYKNNLAPDLLLSLNWNTGKNKNGFPGGTYADTSVYPVGGGMHGSFSPYDMHNILIATGPSFQSGLISNYPSGNIDLAPTILYLLGLTNSGMDGRILEEAFTGSILFSKEQWEEKIIETEGISYKQRLVVKEFAGREYFTMCEVNK